MRRSTRSTFRTPKFIRDRFGRNQGRIRGGTGRQVVPVFDQRTRAPIGVRVHKATARPGWVVKQERRAANRRARASRKKNR